MPLNIKNPKVEKMISEISDLTGETKTEAVRKAVEERRRTLKYVSQDRDRAARLRRFFLQEIWPQIPPAQKGRKLTKKQEEAILGFGKAGL
jgi:antitoxin VapB